MQNIVQEESKLKNFLCSKNELDVSEEKCQAYIKNGNKPIQIGSAWPSVYQKWEQTDPNC